VQESLPIENHFICKIVEQCIGCQRIIESDIIQCKAYIKPSVWWRNGKYCPLATHYIPPVEKKEEKKRAGQQKQKKH
jgi:hypothetical protein